MEYQLAKSEIRKGAILMLTPFTTPQELAAFLGTSYKALNYVLYKKDINDFYTTFEISKKNGCMRKIRAPNPQLKTLQRRLKKLLEEVYNPHSAAAAFIEGRGIVYNASKHIKKSVVFNIDLQNFYDQIHFGRIRGLLISKPYSLQEKTATMIAQMCCAEKVLPQGAPTSPILSNMICRKLDRQLSFLAKEYFGYYTRYADDITFSFRTMAENNIYVLDKDIATPHESLLEIIHSNGFNVNNDKTRLQKYDERQVVTGLKVNKKVNIDRRYIRTTRAMIFSLSKGIEEANEYFKELYGDVGKKLEYVVFGRINYIGMVKGKESSVYQTLAKKFNNLGLTLNVPVTTNQRKKSLENELHFYSYENRNRLEKCVWIVTFEGVENLEIDQELVQATAFILKGQRILTAAHAFIKAGNPKYCFLHRINDQNKKYKASLVSKCDISDIAELKFDDENLPKFNYLQMAPLKDLHKGYKLSAVGFPQLRLGHESVTILPCTVTNSFKKSTYRHVEVDVEFHAGISGGPVINAYLQVVGMVLLGMNTSIDFDAKTAQNEGNNAFISAEHF